MNDPHFILERWIMDANMHKNGMMMVKPVREQITRYVETQGTLEQLRAFEQQAAEGGLTSLRQSRRRITVNMDKVAAEVSQLVGEARKSTAMGLVDSFMQKMADNPSGDGSEQMDGMTDHVQGATDEMIGEEQGILNDSIARNSIYSAKYKLNRLWNQYQVPSYCTTLLDL